MNRQLLLSRLRLLSALGFCWGAVGALAPDWVRAEVPLTRADIESIYNSVDFIEDGQGVRPATLSDWLNLGDAVRTLEDSRAELRFNDGSLARIGEQATFWFVPNTRDFRLSNGTALFLIPPERGPSNIQTPSAVTGIQGTALVVRHIPNICEPDSESTVAWEECPGRTVVMVLTESPKGPVEVTTNNGMTEPLSAGNMAVIEGNSIQVMEFNLELFYQTSPLVDGLNLNNPSYEGSGSPTDPVRQETWDGIRSQEGFEGSYLVNPELISVNADLSLTTSWLLPENAADGVSIPTTSSNTANLSEVDSYRQAQRRFSGNSMMSSMGGSVTAQTPTRSPLPAGIIAPSVTAANSSGNMGSVATPPAPQQTPTQPIPSGETPSGTVNQPQPQPPVTTLPVPDGGSGVTPTTPSETPATPINPPNNPVVNPPNNPILNPTQPTSPPVTETPSQPTQPLTPPVTETPIQPTQPTTPAVPAVPAVPAQPGQPATPAVPAQPAVPSNPTVSPNLPPSGPVTGPETPAPSPPPTNVPSNPGVILTPDFVPTPTDTLNQVTPSVNRPVVN